MHKTFAFTLIELLVVVTIIVVLISMLLPAMEKAIYQAELAVCGTRQHAIASGALTYTVDYKRRYPYRPNLRNLQAARSIEIYGGYLGVNGDDRPVLKQFLSLNNHLICPFAAKVDIEGSAPDSGVTSSFALWFGFQYRAGKPETGMFRLGDRFTWLGDRFNVLASDWDSTYTEGLHFATHPDALGVISPFVYQDRDFATGLALGPLKLTSSFWSSTEATRGIWRGLMDTNYAFDDGSVKRFDRVEWNEGDPTRAGNRRLVWAPQRGDGYNTNPTWQVQLPKP